MGAYLSSASVSNGWLPSHPSLQPTPLMCLEVVAMLPVRPQGIFRSAGTSGVAVYEELVAQGRIAVCVEVGGGDVFSIIASGDVTTPDGVGPHNVPLQVPLLKGSFMRNPLDKLFNNKNMTIVLNQFEATRRGGLSILDVSMREFHHIRYVCDDSITSLSMADHHHPGCSKSLVHSVTLMGCNNVRDNQYLFLSFAHITSLDIAPLRNLTKIGKGFASQCTSLASIDLSPLRNVTSIESLFLSQCESLLFLDFGPLERTTTIGNGFLNRCTGLVTVDLSGLRNVVEIGGWFMAGCTALETVDVTPLRNVSEIGVDFMFRCISLKFEDGDDDVDYGLVLAPRWREVQTALRYYLAANPA